MTRSFFPEAARIVAPFTPIGRELTAADLAGLGDYRRPTAAQRRAGMAALCGEAFVADMERKGVRWEYV